MEQISFYNKVDLVIWMKESYKIHTEIVRNKRLLAKDKNNYGHKSALENAEHDLYMFRRKFENIPLAVHLVGRILKDGESRLWQIKKFNPIRGELQIRRLFDDN